MWESLSGLLSPPEVPVLPPEPVPEPPSVTLTLPALVRDVTLTLEQRDYLKRLKSCRVYVPGGTREDYDLDGLAISGRLNDLSRWGNLFMVQLRAGLRATGDRALLERIYMAMQLLRSTLKANTGDGFRGWLYWNPDDLKLHGKDTTTMEEIMAHSLVAACAATFDDHRALHAKYAEAADFWRKYLVDDYEAKWRKRSGKMTGYPIIEKELFHPYTNSLQYHHYMHRLTRDDAHAVELKRLLTEWRSQVMIQDGAYVWPHIVNAMRDSASAYGWILQKYSYSGETLSAIADLGFEGVLSDAEMRMFAKTVRVMLANGGPNLLAGDCGGGNPDGYDLFYPLLGKVCHFNRPDVPNGTAHEWLTRGYGLLSFWDESSEIAQVSYRFENGNYMLPIVSLLLAR